MLHGETVTLKCSYSVELTQITWFAGHERLYRASVEDSVMVIDDINERIKNHDFEGNSHKITITVNKIDDENKLFKCSVAGTTGISKECESLHPILSKLNTVNLLVI